jgi:hypothetical protein
MESIQIENMPGTFIEVIETSTAGYIVGVIHIEESVLVEATTTEDWSTRIAGGAYALHDLLLQLFWLTSEKVSSYLERSVQMPGDQAKVEFLQQLMSDLSDLRQTETIRANAAAEHQARQ